jgi:hypothetical protein
MASLTMTGRGNALDVANILTDGIQNSGMSCELVDRVSRVFGETSFYLMVFDKYFMRNSSRASLTVSVIGNGDEIWVDAVGSGGGQGAIFNFSWGAEEDFISVVGEILNDMGFTAL